MSRQIETLAARLTHGLDAERARAVRIHDFVRDRIAFGFTPRLDDATPEQTLDEGVGHTIAKTALFVALLRATGLQARQHFVTIDHDILRGLFAHAAHRLLPWEILHAYAEVAVDGRWWCVDSYALDTPLWRAATARLWAEGALLGYGAHRNGTCRWAGAGHAFAQLATRDMVVEDHGAFTDLREFRQTWAWAGRRRVRASDPLLDFANESVAIASARCLNEHLDRLRAWRREAATVSASA